jgi:hypothetical protein
MAGLSLYCAGEIDLSALTCSTGWQSVVANPPFDISQLDPELLAVMFAGGFFFMVPVWVACIGVQKLLSVIR